jgi:hypothetical protein
MERLSPSNSTNLDYVEINRSARVLANNRSILGHLALVWAKSHLTQRQPGWVLFFPTPVGPPPGTPIGGPIGRPGGRLSCGGCAAFLLLLLLILAIGGGIVWYVLAHRNGA